MADLRKSLKTHARSATFACGGSVTFKTNNDTKSDPNAIDSVHLRFGESGKGTTLTLPLSSTSSEHLDALVKACQPASFGRGNEEVLDESYRKAGKLDRAAFATTFFPYEAGIVDVVSQLLVPQTKQDKHHCSIKVPPHTLLTSGFRTLADSYPGRVVQAECVQRPKRQVQGNHVGVTVTA